jgi:hypothetical protein
VKRASRNSVEFDFPYNNQRRLDINDNQRAKNILDGVVGEGLTYQTN